MMTIKRSNKRTILLAMIAILSFSLVLICALQLEADAAPRSVSKTSRIKRVKTARRKSRKIARRKRSSRPQREVINHRGEQSRAAQVVRRAIEDV